MSFREEYKAKQEAKTRRAEFLSAVTHYALKKDLDPKALEAVYRGRENNLVAHWKVSTESRASRIISGSIGGGASILTGLLYMQPNHDYISYPHDGGIKDAFMMALPFVMIGLSGLAVAANTANIRIGNNAVAANVRALADGRLKQLPPPKKDSKAGLI